MSHAQTGPQSIYIDCQSPSGSQGGLKRPRGDSNVWVFQIVPGASVHWVEGPNWSYPGKSGSDPSWGQWSGGDGSLSLSWISPEHTGAFSVGVTGKITCGSGGDGAPIDISATWSGDVLAKEWEADPDIEGGKMMKPQNQTVSPATPSVVLVKTNSEVDCEVTEATDKDKWTAGEDEGEDDDTVKYKWTASGGGFVTSEHPTGDAPNAETRTAKWKAPAEPGDYTLECTIDDLPKELKENETGTRDDEPVQRVLQVKVVKMEFVPPVIRLYAEDTKEVDVLITPEDAGSLFTFAMLDTDVATHSGAPVTFTITGVAAGNTKFQAKYEGKVFGEATVIVKEHIDDETDDLDDDGLLDIFDDDIDGDGIIDNTPAKLWSPDTGISGGKFAVSEVTVAAGGTIGLEVSPASDTDKWRKGTESDHESDTVHYNWSGGNVTANSAEPWKSTFTAPSQAGEYYVQVKIDDEPAAVVSPDRGNRDDSAVTRTIKVIVTQKKWDIDLAIGKYHQEDGTVKENGRMVLPQDQTGENPMPEHVKVFAGATIDLSLEEATDVDHWKLEPDSAGEEGYDNDTVIYLWEAPSGQIVGDAHQRNAKWQAPMEAGTYTITCTIDDTPKAIDEGEDGIRDDSSVKRTVEVEVVNGESSATLKLYKDEELTEEADDAVGGTAYIVLEVKLGEGQHMVSNSATLRVEENYAQHSDTEKRWDSAVSFASGWQKKDANGEWQNSVSSPQSTNNSDDDEYYRKVWPWATTSTPLGHNENHSIKLVKVDGGEETELKFAGAIGESETKGTSGISADVKNLVITEAKTSEGNEDYLVYDPNSENSQHTNPSVTFKFEDKGGFQEGDEYRWTVLLIETSGAVAWSQSDIASEPGSVPVDLTPSDAGVFGFDVSIKHYRDGVLLEGVSCKSLFVKFDDDNLTVNDNNQFEFQYHIAPTGAVNDVDDLSEANITMLAGDWSEETQTSGPKTLNPLPAPAHTVILPDPTSNEPGEGRVVLTGVDSETLSYRDHKNRRVYPKNDVGPRTYYLLTGNGPYVNTVDSGQLSQLRIPNLKLSDGLAVRILTLPLDTHQSPEAIWMRLANIKRYPKSGGGTYQHALVTTFGHSSQTSHDLSTLPGGLHPGGEHASAPQYPAWTVGNGFPAGYAYPLDNNPNYETSIADYSIGAQSTPHLNGVSFYNMMGCDSSKSAHPLEFI